MGGASALILAAGVEPDAVAADNGLRIGVCADAHYADADARGQRHYRLSLERMREAVASWNTVGVDVAVELGDFVDSGVRPDSAEELGFLHAIEAEFSKVRALRCHVLGNHCVATLPKATFLRAVRQRRSWYSFDRRNVHCIVLDACFRKDGVSYDAGPFDWRDTEIPAAQRDWLAEDLKRTRRRTVVFVHQRLDLPQGDPYAVYSSATVRGILEESHKVCAVVMGHSHENALQRIAGIPYIALDAMVDGDDSAGNAFSILHVSPDGAVTLEASGRHLHHPMA